MKPVTRPTILDVDENVLTWREAILQLNIEIHRLDAENQLLRDKVDEMHCDLLEVGNR